MMMRMMSNAMIRCDLENVGQASIDFEFEKLGTSQARKRGSSVAMTVVEESIWGEGGLSVICPPIGYEYAVCGGV
jgi:hypothetical protein